MLGLTPSRGYVGRRRQRKARRSIWRLDHTCTGAALVVAIPPCAAAYPTAYIITS
jgi:hypothetical protein